MFGELIGAFEGPALVIGGGPSVPMDLMVLSSMKFKPSVVISANEHGHRQSTYKVTHSVCLDPRHGEKHIGMDALLRQFGDQPIITPCWFGTDRLAEWKLAANTGLTSIVVGVFMAGSVVVTGIDFYRLSDPKAATYFHDPQGKSNSTLKSAQNFERQVKAVEAWITAAPPVRAVSGALSQRWGTFDERGISPLDWRVLPHARFQREQPSIVLQAHPSLPVQFGMGRVPAMARFVVSPNEARSPVTSRRAKLIEAFPPADKTELVLPRELTDPGGGYSKQVLAYHAAKSPLLKSKAERE